MADISSRPGLDMPDPLPVVGEPSTPPTTGEAGPASMGRWLWFAYPLATLSISMVWGGVLTVLLGRQVAGFGGGSDSDAGVLGVVVSIAAVVALLVTPVLGRLSDRTRVRFLGRRNIWMLGGAWVGAVVLVITGLSPSVTVLAVAWALAMIPLNGYQAALAAVLPERVPAGKRGIISGLAGTAALVGVTAGVAVTGLSGTPLTGYIIVAAQLVVVASIFAFTTRDPALAVTADVSAAPAPTSSVPGLRSHPDFWWAFLGRFLTFLGYGVGTGLQLYVLRDYIGVGDGSTDAAAKTLVTVSSIGAVFLILSGVVGGLLADKMGRLKPFVILASLLFVPGALVVLVFPTLTGMIVSACVTGLGFGAYIAVDQALMAQVLPNVEDAGRDLGLLNMANAGPQIISPALAGAIVAGLGYPPLYVTMIILSVLGAVAVTRVRGVR